MTDIRIEDLAAPVLNDVQRMAIEYGDSRHTDLTAEAVCEAAVARTGLDDFGPGDFVERLGLQLAEMDADEERTGIGQLRGLPWGDLCECGNQAKKRVGNWDI